MLSVKTQALMQLNCLFWNAGRKSPDAEVAAIALANQVNLIALTEYADTGVALLHELTRLGLSFFLVPNIGCERIKLLTTFPPSHFVHSREADRYTIKELCIPGALHILLCMAHLPSKLHSDDIDQLHTATYFKQDIELAEIDSGHTNSVVFGDFNMNPFDDGMVSAAALNSLPCLATAKKSARVISGKTHNFFYNPTWNLLGDFKGIPGTYYHSSPGYKSHYWNMLDQVVIRPSIADRFDKNSFSILTDAGTTSLIGGNGKPSISDHLPLFFSINLT